jgi:hypothetical protein
MRQKWSEFGNAESTKLVYNWNTIGGLLDWQSGPDAHDVWPVVPCELGAGKSTAAKVWCATRPADDSHPGVLIVVRTKDQADEYARDINTWSGNPRLAFAYHSGLALAARRDLNALANYRVLIVCHKSYENGLDDFAVDVSRLKFEAMHRQRTLVVIDEALDQVHEERIRRDVLKELMAKIPRSVEKAHADAMRVIESVNRVLREAPDERHQVLTAEALLATTTFTPERADMLLVDMWQKGVQGSKRIEPELRVKLGQMISALRRHLGAYRWTSGNGVKTAISGHRLLLLPPGVHGVVLDATARLNNVYLGRPEEFQIRGTAKARDYSNVTIYEARTAGTGKGVAKNQGSKFANKIVGEVLAHYGDAAKDRSVLVVVALAGEKYMQEAGDAASFKRYAVAHWNKIDGRNDWRDFDTLVIATLPYATASIDLNTYMAINETALDEDALNAPPDEVKLVRENRIAAQLAQAMGRIRLRTMTNADGSCEPCDIFLRLPLWKHMVDPERVLDAVRRTLPGASVVRWELASGKLNRPGQPPRARAAVVERLLELADLVAADGTARELSKDSLKATNGTLHRELAKAQDPANQLCQDLAERGVRVQAGGHKPGVRGQTPAMLVRS